MRAFDCIRAPLVGMVGRGGLDACQRGVRSLQNRSYAIRIDDFSRVGSPSNGVGFPAGTGHTGSTPGRGVPDADARAGIRRFRPHLLRELPQRQAQDGWSLASEPRTVGRAGTRRGLGESGAQAAIGRDAAGDRPVAAGCQDGRGIRDLSRRRRWTARRPLIRIRAARRCIV